MNQYTQPLLGEQNQINPDIELVNVIQNNSIVFIQQNNEPVITNNLQQSQQNLLNNVIQDTSIVFNQLNIEPAITNNIQQIQQNLLNNVIQDTSIVFNQQNNELRTTNYNQQFQQNQLNNVIQDTSIAFNEQNNNEPAISKKIIVEYKPNYEKVIQIYDKQIALIKPKNKSIRITNENYLSHKDRIEINNNNGQQIMNVSNKVYYYRPAREIYIPIYVAIIVRELSAVNYQNCTIDYKLTMIWRFLFSGIYRQWQLTILEAIKQGELKFRLNENFMVLDKQNTDFNFDEDNKVLRLNIRLDQKDQPIEPHISNLPFDHIVFGINLEFESLHLKLQTNQKIQNDKVHIFQKLQQSPQQQLQQQISVSPNFNQIPFLGSFQSQRDLNQTISQNQQQFVIEEDFFTLKFNCHYNTELLQDEKIIDKSKKMQMFSYKNDFEVDKMPDFNIDYSRTKICLYIDSKSFKGKIIEHVPKLGVQLRIYREPESMLWTIPTPAILLQGLLILTYFSLDDIGQSMGNIATLFLASIAFIPAIRQQIPSQPKLTLAEFVVYGTVFNAFLSGLFIIIRSQVYMNKETDYAWWLGIILSCLVLIIGLSLFVYRFIVYLIKTARPNKNYVNQIDNNNLEKSKSFSLKQECKGHLGQKNCTSKCFCDQQCLGLRICNMTHFDDNELFNLQDIVSNDEFLDDQVVHNLAKHDFYKSMIFDKV